MKNSIILILIVFVWSCDSGQQDVAEDQEIMGKFDSVMIEQQKAPSTQYHYENQVEHIQFPSQDSLLISADIYQRGDGPIDLLLCHQAGYSRGAYINTAILLSHLGYNSMVIDLRSGDQVNEIVNETAKLAKSSGLATGYIDALQDIEAAVDYLYARNNSTPIVVLGSSYSASLALIVGKYNDKVKAIAAFSPGEYLEEINVSDTLKGVKKPVFVTSSKMEIPQTKMIISNIDSAYITHFKPKVEGVHGAKALWKDSEDYKVYWKELLAFLKMVKSMD